MARRIDQSLGGQRKTPRPDPRLHARPDRRDQDIAGCEMPEHGPLRHAGALCDARHGEAFELIGAHLLDRGIEDPGAGFLAIFVADGCHVFCLHVITYDMKT